MTWEPPEIVPPTDPGRPHPYPPVPMVYGPGPDDELRSRVYEQMLARRTVFLDRGLDGETATLVAAQLMTLDADADGESPVTLIVNSEGGPLEAVAGLLDTIELLHCPVDTTCLGQAGGTAAVVVAAGTGRRRAGAGAQFRLRLSKVELLGSATRLGHDVAHLRALHDALIDRLVAATGQDRRLVARDVERGRALSADEAVAYRLVDEVIKKGG
ncbi:MAG: ATP-dependent Clp protease proteolytic subunit [Acidimicrobiales bacterium]